MRVVVKVGSSVLIDNDKLSVERIGKLVDFLQDLHQNHEVILVSSGAVAAGHTVVPTLSNKTTADKQALAAVGQTVLIRKYRKKFEEHNIHVAQLLLTKDDFQSFAHSENAKTAINTLLENKIVPIINENDCVVVDELLRGDNDFLSAQVTEYFGGDLLIILSDIDGYYDKNPREFSDAKILKVVSEIPKEELEQENTPNFEFATGGIVTKLKAADFLMKNGKKMFLTTGFELSHAKDFIDGQENYKGTLFC
ncbi:MAG: glutamate 5-kinase [Campylobacterales bacterium]|nr:glutamate 5-kinase [Campylobacterales bacterium]